MNESVLQQYRAQHNQFASLASVAWLVVAIPAWFASWWLVRFFLAIILHSDIGLETSFDTAAWIALGVTPLLFFEVYRYGKDSLERENFLDALYYLPGPQNYVQPQRPNPYKWKGQMNPLSQAFTLDILLIAPRSTVRAYQSIRSRVRMNETVADSAEAVVAQLARDDNWTPAEKFRQHVDALRPLEKLEVLRSRVTDGQVLVRLETDFLDELAKAKSSTAPSP